MSAEQTRVNALISVGSTAHTGDALVGTATALTQVIARKYGLFVAKLAPITSATAAETDLAAAAGVSVSVLK